MITATPISIPGCYLLRPVVRTDERGSFIKTFHRPSFAGLPFRVPFEEEYLTASQKGVLRGLHFQMPPYALDKLVQCVSGAVFDVALDLRKGSPRYGKHEAVMLDSAKGDMFFLPKGIAHGFCALTDNARLLYKVSCVYAPECDTGIRWDSAGIAWPEAAPMVSARDLSFPALAEFQSPFVYEPNPNQLA